MAIDGRDGRVKWQRQYDELARKELWWLPVLRRRTTVDGLITVTDSGLWIFFDLDYEIEGGGRHYPQPRKVVVARVDAVNGDVLDEISLRDTSAAFLIPDSDGNLYVTLSGTASSIAYYGVNPKLPWFLRVRNKPVGGLVAFSPGS